MPAGLANAGRSTLRAEPGERHSVATETTTKASRPMPTAGTSGETLGATAEVEGEGEDEFVAEGDAVTLVEGDPDRSGEGMGVVGSDVVAVGAADETEVPGPVPADDGDELETVPPVHDVTRAMQPIITTEPGLLTRRALPQNGPGSSTGSKQVDTGRVGRSTLVNQGRRCEEIENG